VAAALSLAFGLASCSDLPPKPEGPEVTDSSGIQIVLSRSPAWGPEEGWTVSDDPLVQIGVREGDPDYQFQRIWEARRLSDGRFITADDMAKELRIFDSSGGHLRTIGGDGEGPGEFRAVWLVGVYRGDSIYAYDYALMRASIFTPAGVFARSVENARPSNTSTCTASTDKSTNERGTGTPSPAARSK
jgi:hypothetical protein